MEAKIATLTPFFRQPARRYLIRELAKLLHTNHMTVRQRIHACTKEGLLIKKQATPYDVFVANPQSKKYLNLKTYYNLELIRTSHLVEMLEQTYNYPPIILFGSFSRAIDDEKSDVDVCVVSDVRRSIDISAQEKVIGKHISIHYFTKKDWADAKRKNPELVNNIANGITLSGQLEVV